jgi:hypothetical protein
MLDVSLAAKLATRVAADTHLLLVGDDDQQQRMSHDMVDRNPTRSKSSADDTPCDDVLRERFLAAAQHRFGTLEPMTLGLLLGVMIYRTVAAGSRARFRPTFRARR